MPLPDLPEDILTAAQRGSESAFETIVKTYEQPIFRYIYRMVNRQHDAEDLTQETFIKAYRHIARFDSQLRFSTWLFTIATRTVYDWLRKRRIRPEVLVDTVPETKTASSTYKRVDIKLDINAALQSIKPEYRSVLLLYYVEGYSYLDIAHALDLPVNTVKTYVHRGKIALRKLMDAP